MTEEVNLNDMNLDDLSEEELMELAKQMGVGYPQQEEKFSIPALFNKFFQSKESTKIGNLNEDELFAVRGLLHASNFCKTLRYKLVGEYFDRKAENLNSTSMSKNFAFVLAAITQKRSLNTSENQIQGGKRKWLFGKKDQQQTPEQQQV